MALAGKRVLFSDKFGWGSEMRLKALVKAHGGTLATALNAKIDYLVLPDLSTGKTVQKAASALNAKGAGIQIIDTNDFEKLTQLSDEDVLQLIRGGKKNAELFSQICGFHYDNVAGTKNPPRHLFAGEKFDNLDLTGFHFSGIAFEKCRFAGCELSKADFDITRDCNFTKARGFPVEFREVSGCDFTGATFGSVAIEGEFHRANFSNVRGTLHFTDWAYPSLSRNQKKSPIAAGRFRKAALSKSEFTEILMEAPDFAGADLSASKFEQVEAKDADFTGANLAGAALYKCKLPGGRFARADLSNANLAESDLTDADFTGANLAGCNLRGAILTGAKLEKARNYKPAAAQTGAAGPALTALEKIANKAHRLEVTFNVVRGKTDETASIYSWPGGSSGIRLPNSVDLDLWGSGRRTFSQATMQLANALGDWQVRFETISVKSTKASKPNKELRELALQGVQEAFGQAPPDEEALAAAAKAHREKAGKQASAEKKKRAAARAASEKRQLAAKAKAIADLTAKAGVVSDLPTFMKAIEVRTDKEKVKKATKMLKALGFQLFNDVAPTHLYGVVKSQTDPDLVYACRVDQDGQYACCTQNLNICGGLRGSICKHLLVLIIGLVNAGQLDPTTIDAWVAKTAGGKPELDKEVMSDIFIRYKGAEAGDIDWRPTETVPEDYYAL